MLSLKKLSSRNIKFNYYLDNSTLYTLNSTTMSSKIKNAQLLDTKEAIKLTGKQIIDDANKNPIFKLLKNPSTNPLLWTNNLNSSETYYVYGAPHKYVFDNLQQYSDCGVCSALNILVMAGIKTILDQNKTENEFLKECINNKYAIDDGIQGILDSYDGVTTIKNQSDILSHYGVTNKLYADGKLNGSDNDNKLSFELIAQAIKEGRGVILEVHSKLLTGEIQEEEDISAEEQKTNHSIIVTGVVYDSLNNIKGFYIHDTSIWMTRYVSFNDLSSMSRAKCGIDAIITDNSIISYDININGNSLANTINGNNKDNIIKGMAGSDRLIGCGGNDTIYGGSGNDIIYGNDENNTTEGKNELYGGSGNDTIYAGINGDDIKGESGNDIIYGNVGDDVIYGNSGNDVIYGGLGNDAIYGGSGNDKIRADEGDDFIDCGSGNDIIYYSQNSSLDTVISNSGSVTFDFSQNCDFVSALNINFNDSNILIKDENNNGADFTTFFNYSKNKCQTTYIQTKQEKYRISATNSKGTIKVAYSKGNNILYSLNKNKNTINTSKYNDIIYSNGDDTIVYIGGCDKYFANNGNNTYKINKISENSIIEINDDMGDDTIIFNSKNIDFLLFFNVYSQDAQTDNDLYIINDVENLNFNSENEPKYLIKINDYFGNGKIEIIKDKYKAYDISSSINLIKQQVSAWLSDNSYNSTIEALESNREGAIQELVAIYSNTKVETV